MNDAIANKPHKSKQRNRLRKPNKQTARSPKLVVQNLDQCYFRKAPRNSILLVEEKQT